MVVVRLRPYDPHSLGSPGVAKDEIDSGLHSLVWSSNRRILTHTPTNNKKPSAKADGFLWLGGTVSNSLLSNDPGAVSGGLDSTRVSGKVRQLGQYRGGMSQMGNYRDNMQNHQQIGRFSDEQLASFKTILSERLGREATDEETFESASALMNLCEALYDVAHRLHRWDERLKTEPGGFTLPVSISGGSYNCGICYATIAGEQGWYDQHGIKCRVCQKAVEDGVIPGTVCSNKKSWYSANQLNTMFDWHHSTIYKKTRTGELKARIIKTPEGANHYFVFLKEENSDLTVE